MQFVIEAEETDGETFAVTYQVPVEAESIDKVMVAFLSAASAALLEGKQSFELFGVDWYTDECVAVDLSLSAPPIYSVEEWFQRKAVKI